MTTDLSAIVTELRAEIAELRMFSTAAKDYAVEHKKVLRLKRQLAAAEMRADLNFDCWRKSLEGNGAGIPSDLLQTLIRLCHPDRHGNSDAANKATAWH